MLAHKGCTVDLFAANHRLEHGGLDLVNTNFDSDRAYGVISDSKGSRGHKRQQGQSGAYRRPRWRQKRQPQQIYRNIRDIMPPAHIKKRHIMGIVKI